MTEKIKTPVLKPENILPELESENGYQSLELEFRDESNDLNIEVTCVVWVKVEWDGDGYNLPRTCTIKSDIYTIDFDATDDDGDKVQDEDNLILTELKKQLTNKYQNL